MGSQWIPVPITDPTVINNAVSYSGQAWVNPNTGELIIANRGTVPSLSGNLVSDAQLGLAIVNQAQSTANAFAVNAITNAQAMLNPGVSLSQVYTTGHSLGGSESQGQSIFLSSIASQYNFSLTNISFDAPGIGGISQSTPSNVASYNFSSQGDIVNKTGWAQLNGTIDVSANWTTNDFNWWSNCRGLSIVANGASIFQFAGIALASTLVY